jgi:hypothetical protein
MIENPLSFVVGTELHKAAFDNGFRIDLGMDFGWLHFRSTTAQGEIRMGAAGKDGPWFLSVSPLAIAAEMGLPPLEGAVAPGQATYAFPGIAELYEALDRAYRLGASLPDAPLRQFVARTSGVGRATEAERLVVQRVGQEIFREALLRYWNGCCPMTGIGEAALLRASHIVPWAECETDALRLDVHNGLLLSALWDAAFDAGLVSFGDGGEVLRSARLGEEAGRALGDGRGGLGRLTAGHRANLSRHRAKFGFGGGYGRCIRP